MTDLQNKTDDVSPVYQVDMNALAYAYEQPQVSAQYKVKPEDFQVEEQIAFPLSGEGEHLWCWVEKRGQNTDWVAQQLAKWAGVSTSRVGVAGQKDRYAVTRQWFSIQLPGKESPDIDSFQCEDVAILRCVRHQRKLQTGGLSANRFTIVLRHLQVEGLTDDQIKQDVSSRLQAVEKGGVPNYFGEQRFGRSGRNLEMGVRFLNGELTRLKRTQKSLYISAVRSFVFNQYLSQRVDSDSWCRALAGDAFQLAGSNKWFVDDGSANLAQRVDVHDLHPTGPLIGKGVMEVEQDAKSLEEKLLERYSDWLRVLADFGVKQDRRALRVMPEAFTWQWIESTDSITECSDCSGLMLEVSFTLRPGSYASMVLRELVHASDAQR